MGWGFREAEPLQLILCDFYIEKWFNDSGGLSCSLINHALVTGCVKWVCGLTKGLEHGRGGRDRCLLLWLEKL